MNKKVGQGGDFFSNNVKKCFWYDFLSSQGMAELTWVFCDLDKLWFEEINPELSGVEFNRPTTISAGDDMCRFEFKRSIPKDKNHRS